MTDFSTSFAKSAYPRITKIRFRSADSVPAGRSTCALLFGRCNNRILNTGLSCFLFSCQRAWGFKPPSGTTSSFFFWPFLVRDNREFDWRGSERSIPRSRTCNFRQGQSNVPNNSDPTKSVPSCCMEPLPDILRPPLCSTSPVKPLGRVSRQKNVLSYLFRALLAGIKFPRKENRSLPRLHCCPATNPVLVLYGREHAKPP